MTDAVQCAACATVREHRKSEHFSKVAKKLRGHDSFLCWVNTAPTNTKSDKENDGAVELRIGENKIATTQTCVDVDPFDHKALMDWIRDVKP